MLMTAAVTVLFVGCEAIEQKGQSQQLDISLKAYAGAIRWSNFDTAALFAVPRAGANTVDPASLGGIKVTGYSIRIDSLNETVDEANVQLSFTYYDENRGTVGTVNQRAQWYLDPTSQSWLMDDSLPHFKR